MRTSVHALGIGMLVATAVVGCGAAPNESGSESPTLAPSLDRLQSLDYDLAPGATGEDVRVLHAYLAQYGYFPNPALAQAFPAWRPIVAEGPADAAVYDEHTAAAIRHLQGTARLDVNGIVDDRTRAILRTARCGIPEGIQQVDPDDKFAVLGAKWFGSNVTWRVVSAPPGISLTDMRNAVINASATWAAETSRTFSEVGSNENITIDTLGFGGNTLGQTAITYNPGSNIIHSNTWIDTTHAWSVATPTPAGKYDLYSTVLHEMGHAIGLKHSALGTDTGGAVMSPLLAQATQKRWPQLDDKVAISATYDAWDTGMGQSAVDIGAGLDGSVWIVKSNNQVWKWNGPGTTTFTQDTGGMAALRIAVDFMGIPWVIRTDSRIFRKQTGSPTIGSWVEVAGNGFAQDIAVGSDIICDGSGCHQTSAAWVIGTGGADGNIFKLVNSVWTMDQSGGAAQRIAVSAYGKPMVTTSSGGIYRYSTNDPMTGSWGTPLPGAARDIGIGPVSFENGVERRYAWVIGTGQGPDTGIYAFDDQQGCGDPNCEPPQVLTWVQLPGNASVISVGPNGNPWVVTSGGFVFKTIK
jgi:peptidoglycan hydrolase-like protein with peptidoglycan-binding domain